VARCLTEPDGLTSLGWKEGAVKSTKMDAVAVVVWNCEAVEFQKGGAARVFLWPAIQAAVSVVSEEFWSVLLCWFNDAIAFSERGAEGP
jgi:hypothetical protein